MSYSYYGSQDSTKDDLIVTVIKGAAVSNVTFTSRSSTLVMMFRVTRASAQPPQRRHVILWIVATWGGDHEIPIRTVAEHNGYQTRS